MKTVKSALLGTRQIVAANQTGLEYHFREIVKEHRALVINRLLNDIPTYLDYKFQVSRPSKVQLEEIKNSLLNLRNGYVQLTHYQHLFQQLETRALIHLTNEPFYVEIDECVGRVVAPEQLKFV